MSVTPSKILRVKEVLQRIGLARSTLYTMTEAGSFPQPVRLGARAIGWHESEVETWISSRKVIDLLEERPRPKPVKEKHKIGNFVQS